MRTADDWAVELDGEAFVAQTGGSLPKLLERPAVRADWDAALADARTLVEPAAAWDTFPIREFRHERLILADGTRLGGGPVADVTAGATELIVAVVTAGSAISERASELQAQGRRLHAMFLDDFGSWAVDQVRQQFCRRIEAEAASQGLRASAALSPGESAWPVDEQAVIFKLLDAGRIGVSLTPSLVMRPIKSLSLIVGLGSGPLGVEGGSNCDFCTIRERCAYRHRRG
jgi:cobalamin-dependent methionine synthase I